MIEGSGRMSTTEKEGGTTRLRNELKRVTGVAKKEYLERECDEIMALQRAGLIV